MIVRTLDERIQFLFLHRGLTVSKIAARVHAKPTHVRERLHRMGLWPRRALKSKDQRVALGRLRIAAGKRTLGSAYEPGAVRARKPQRRKTTTRMIVWRGHQRSTEIECLVTDRGVGAGETICIGCAGSKMVGDEQCVECKGSGRMFVSV